VAEINRVWAMPNKATFTIKPIANLLSRYIADGKGWVDPFAGHNSPAEWQNDLDTASPVPFHLDALDFLKLFPDSSQQGCLLDPPYSITQARECYNGYGMDKLDIKPTSMKYWAEIKNQMRRITVLGGSVICCGWSSMGLGKNRGFEMLEVLLVPHGGSKNDTIVTVEVKTRETGKETE